LTNSGRCTDPGNHLATRRFGINWDPAVLASVLLEQSAFIVTLVGADKRLVETEDLYEDVLFSALEARSVTPHGASPMTDLFVFSESQRPLSGSRDLDAAGSDPRSSCDQPVLRSLKIDIGP
jgi:hypothetical protein